MNNSRFITPPSTVKNRGNHTVVLIDAENQDINELHVFFTSSVKDFDVYLYQGDYGDLEYLNYITNQADWVLIHADSQVSIQNYDKQTKFGSGQSIRYPAEYFEQIQKQFIDKTIESVL
jgi:hypothetical protein